MSTKTDRDEFVFGATNDGSDIPEVDPNTESLEEELLKQFETADATDEADASADDATDEGTPPTDDVDQPVASADANAATTPQSGDANDTAVFAPDGTLALKAGTPLTEAHVKELQRSFFREADYTKKTQEIADIRKQATEVLSGHKQVLEDPKALRQFFEDAHILKAFTRDEMLNFGLASAGVPVPLWNEFIDWAKETGALKEGAVAPKADPYASEFHKIHKEVATLKSSLSAREQAEQAAQEKAAFDREMSRYDKELEAALAEFQGVTKKDVLVLAASQPDTSVKTLRDLAKELHDRTEARFQDYLKTKKQQRTTTVRPARGASVPIVRTLPKTFEEVDTLLESMHMGGTR